MVYPLSGPASTDRIMLDSRNVSLQHSLPTRLTTFNSVNICGYPGGLVFLQASLHRAAVATVNRDEVTASLVPANAARRQTGRERH